MARPAHYPRWLAAGVAGPLACVSALASAATLYVWQESPTPTPPYTNWATAATNIQEAVDVAVAGDEILVTNGVYETGARAVYGMSNRVAVTQPVTVRSVNGPDVTQIMGYQVPGTTNGPAAVRCVYLTNGAVLAGFTLANGATQTNGDYYRTQSGGGIWCEGRGAVVSNCVLMRNSAYYDAGGAFGGTLNNSTIMGNSADSYGGGAFRGTLNNCTFTGNSASEGGGASVATLNNCVFTGNSAMNGGGASVGTLNNCTITGNSADYGGGAFDSTLNNSIVYYNNARYRGANYYGSDFGGGIILNYCCTTPVPAGTSNLIDEPQLASTSHLSVGSPCVGRGNAAYSAGVDLDGEPWANPPSIGCDEYWSGSVTGALSVAVVATYTNVAVGFWVDFQAVIEGRVSVSRWDFGDRSVVSNRPWASHAWAGAGDYVVELRAYNESYPAGVAATITLRVLTQPIHYVALDSRKPMPPYGSWATAATNIQDAVDAATLPGALVWVSNGVYQAGARAVYGTSNRVAVTKPATVRSVNGPTVTQILGYQVPGTRTGPAAMRCAYLTNGAVLAGFTLTNGATQRSVENRTYSGGGVWCEGPSAVVSNCLLTGNAADYEGGGAFSGRLNDCVLTGNSALYGGGAYEGTLDNCVLTGNSGGVGGGAYGGTLHNSVLMGNSATWGGGTYKATLANCALTGNSGGGGGGVYGGTMNNCIVYYNTATSDPNYSGGTLKYCCTTPLPGGPGNLTNAPAFVNTNGWGNLRLQSNSPCINAGNNADAPTTTDLDGLPRIAGGTVDIGAYEFQSPASVISYAWLQHYGLPTDGSADYSDPDSDRLNTWQEWQADTNPTNALSVLRIESIVPGPPVKVQFPSSSNRLYTLRCATNLTEPSWADLPGQIDVPSSGGLMTLHDTNAAPPRFYRVGGRVP